MKWAPRKSEAHHRDKAFLRGNVTADNSKFCSMRGSVPERARRLRPGTRAAEVRVPADARSVPNQQISCHNFLDFWRRHQLQSPLKAAPTLKQT